MLPADRESFLRWVSTSAYRFLHIGWHPVEHWIGRPVSVRLQKPDRTTAGALLASPDRLGTVWIHLYAADRPHGPQSVWDRLWPHAVDSLSRKGLESVWAMPPYRWLIHLLKGSGFEESDRVVAFSMRPSRLKTSFERSSAVFPISESDLSVIERLDQAAFAPPWQMDGDALRETWRRSIWASGFHREGRLAGFLMATPTPQGVHISRLAVHPEHQNKGIGRSLTGCLLENFRRRGIPQITVNTQLQNQRSHRLYRSLGFHEAGKHLPVLMFDVPR